MPREFPPQARSASSSRVRKAARRRTSTLGDEAMYVLEGSIAVICDRKTFSAGPRSVRVPARGISQSWDVTSGTTTVLILAPPGGLDEFLRAFHAADGDARDAVAARYGIDLARGAAT